MAGSVHVVKKDDSVIDARPDVYYSIDEIIIDMTGWAKNDRSGLKNGTYPYCIRFFDSSRQMQSLYCDEMKSNGMIALYKSCRDRYRTVASYNTKITIICPQDAVDDRTSCSSRIYTTDLYKYCDRGMSELPFDIVRDNNCETRLESVLDYICHESTIDYIDTPRIRKAEFENSIYDFMDEEQRLYEDRIEHPVHDDRWFE